MLILPFFLFTVLTLSKADQIRHHLARGIGGGVGRGSGRGRGGGETLDPTDNSTDVTSLTVESTPDVSTISREPFSVMFNGKNYTAVPFGDGNLPNATVQAKDPFGGRKIGGGTFWDTAGTAIYGSGYPGLPERSLEDRGFPYLFFPVVWPSGPGPSYLHREQEYEVASTPRPGGALQQISVFPLPPYDFNNTSPSYIFHVIADTATINYFYSIIPTTCPAANMTSPQPYNQSPHPLPQEAIQYYRSSSVVLTLEGYNNTATWYETNSAVPSGIGEMSPLPTTLNLDFKNCLNETLVEAMPLVGTSSAFPIVSSDWALLSLFLLVIGTTIL